MRHSVARVPRVAVVSPQEVVVRGVTAMLVDYPDRVLVTTMPSARMREPNADVVLYDTLALHDSDGTQLDHLLRTSPEVLLPSRDLRPDLRARGQSKGCVAWVSSHIRNVYQRIGTTSCAQAVGWAMQNGIDPVPT